MTSVALKGFVPNKQQQYEATGSAESVTNGKVILLDFSFINFNSSTSSSREYLYNTSIENTSEA